MRSAKRTRDLLHQGRALTESAILAPMTITITRTMTMTFTMTDTNENDEDNNDDNKRP